MPIKYANNQRDYRGTELYAYIYRQVVPIYYIAKNISLYTTRMCNHQIKVTSNLIVHYGCVCFHSCRGVELKIHHLTSLLEQKEALSLQDQFRYPPYIAEVNLQNVQQKYPGLKNMNEFLLIGLHAHPKNVLAELNALANLYFALNKKHIETQSQRGVQQPSNLNVLILGDLNADGDYFSVKQESSCTLCTQQFAWLISRGVGTNVKLTKAYDRQVSIAILHPK